MEPDDPSQMPQPLLRPLGVSAQAEAAYVRIIDGQGLAADFLTNHLAEVTELVQVGLVQRTESGVEAIPVRLAVERWVADQQTRITRARVAANHFAALQRTTSGSFLELVRGLDAARETFRTLQQLAHHEIRAFDREPYFSQGTVSDEQAAVSDRGVRYRVLYHTDTLEDSASLAAVRSAIAMGEQARFYHDVPMRLAIADDVQALLILPYGSSDTGDPIDIDAIVVHPSTLLDALIRTFEGFWSFGVPVDASAAEVDQRPSEDIRQLLNLLVTGFPDASIARQLGVSERTVHRRVTRLQELLGANSRFLLGVQAVRRGWI